jgi:dimethylargininase
MRALVRAVPASFARALAEAPPDQPIDVERARKQHAAYMAALLGLGCQVERLPPDDRFPDSCFVEDCAVVAGGVALITRPGAESRRGEVDAVADGLRDLRQERMTEPATLDGGDCLRLGRTFFVGLSSRTNRAGVDRLAAAFPDHRVVPVDMPPHVLHLKSVCSPLGGDRVLLAKGTLDPATFAPAEVLVVPRSERHASNAVSIGDGVLIASGAPATRALCERRGLRVLDVDTSEMRKADGALTCLSILF